MLFVMVPRENHEASFQQFWAVYPRRVARKAALKAWQQLKPSPALVTEILTALSWQVQQPGWLKDDGAYVPHGSTYLNQERWTDEPPLSNKVTTWNVSAQSDSGQCPRCGHPGRCVDVKVCNANWLATQRASAETV